MTLEASIQNGPICQFVFHKATSGYLIGERCHEVATRFGNVFCKRHRRRERFQNETREMEFQGAPVDNSFPRIMTNAEERRCVDEVRRRTRPESFVMHGCTICGRLTIGENLIYCSEKELLRSKELLRVNDYYKNVPFRHFKYGGAHYRLDGMILDRRGFIDDISEVVEAAPLMLRVCKRCHSSLLAGKLPDLALVNGLWSGVGQVPEVCGLSWIEEKLIARCHVSVQIQKCRQVKQWHIDAFHPQRKLNGNITTFPVDPTVMLNKLPLSGSEIVGLVKVVFMSSRAKMSLQQACRLRFFIVRRQKVEIALRWLMMNNPLYREVELDQAVLSSLPEDGIPCEVYESITFCDKIVEDMMGRSRYDQADDEEAEEGIASL